MTKKAWFEVDADGLRALQAGKPKVFVLQELLQNALDEAKEQIGVSIVQDGRQATITVSDDGPGFKNIKDAYTLFGDNHKRPDPTKRGRFNIGEKQVFSICKEARILTTCGTIIFDAKGRHQGREHTTTGTLVTITLPLTKDDRQELDSYMNLIIIPDGLTITYNAVELQHKQTLHTIKCNLPTENSGKDGIIRKTRRDTTITLTDRDEQQAHIYEMGLPICPIDHPHHININQRVPLTIDRDNVPAAFLKEVYAHTLNATHQELTPETASDQWVRVATTSPLIEKKPMQTVLAKRFGDKYLSASPTDPLSIDDAISNGYNVIHGGEMSKEEWDNAHRYDLIPSSHELFGKGLADSTLIEPTPEMHRVAVLATRIAKDILNIPLTVTFVKTKANCAATYGNRNITFNVTMLGQNWFKDPLHPKVLDLLIHELSHEYGNHTEHNYHTAITNLASRLIHKALTQPQWYTV